MNTLSYAIDNTLLLEETVSFAHQTVSSNSKRYMTIRDLLFHHCNHIIDSINHLKTEIDMIIIFRFCGCLMMFYLYKISSTTLL